MYTLSTPFLSYYNYLNKKSYKKRRLYTYGFNEVGPRPCLTCIYFFLNFNSVRQEYISCAGFFKNLVLSRRKLLATRIYFFLNFNREGKNISTGPAFLMKSCYQEGNCQLLVFTK